MSEAIGRRIVEARQKSGLSQTDLGLKTGIAQTQISRYESGRSVPRRASMLRLAEALGVQVDWLMSGNAASWPSPISMQVRMGNAEAPPEELIIPPELVHFIRGVAERLNSSTSTAIVEIIKRYMVEMVFAPTGHPRIPNLGTLITEYTDLELKVMNMEAELAALKRDSESRLQELASMPQTNPTKPKP